MKRIILLAVVLTVALWTPSVMAAGLRVSPSDPGQDVAGAPEQMAALGSPLASPTAVDIKNLDTGLTYATIADALADAATLDGHVLDVQVSPHSEGIVNVTKSVTILGGGGGGAVIMAAANTGSSGDARGWFLVSAPGVTFQNVTLDGTGYNVFQAIRCNSAGLAVDQCGFQNIKYSTYFGMAVVSYWNAVVTDCTFSNIERIGVILFGPNVTAGVVSGCAYTGKGAVDGIDYGIELGGGAVATLTGNSITGCTGVASSDGSGSAAVLITTYYGPGTTGTLSNNFLAGNSVGLYMGYDATDVSTVAAFNNDLSNNPEAMAVNTSSTNRMNASGNWWGSADPATVLAGLYGDIDFTPWLGAGTDVGGDPADGFQGDFSVLWVDDDSPQVGAVGRIQEGIGLVSGSTVNVAPGTYTGNLFLNTSVNLLGAQAGVDGRFARGAESVLTGTGLLLELRAGCAASVVDGFTFSGGSRAIESSGGPLNNVQIRNNKFVLQSGTALFLNDSGSDITIHRNLMDGTGGTSTLFHLDQDLFYGIHITENDVINRAAGTGLFVDGNHNISVSGTRPPLIDGNRFEGNQTGANLGRYAFERGTISNNLFKSSGYDGLQGGIQRTAISDNVFELNGRSGLALTGFGGTTTPTRGAQYSSVTGNRFLGNISEGLFFSTSQYPGTISTNVANGNDFIGNTVGASYSGTEVIDVTCNWWGDINGPDVPPGNPNPPGDDIVGTTLQFSPWLNGSITGAPLCNQYGSNYVSADPTGLCLNPAAPCVAVPVLFTRGDTSPARGISVTIQLSTNLELCDTNPLNLGVNFHQGTWLAAYSSTFQVYSNGGGSYTIDQTILGAPCGVTAGGDLFTMDVAASALALPDDVGTITVTGVVVRDCDNAPLPGIPGLAGSLTIDSSVPAAIAALAAVQDKTGNGSDGLTNIDLSWTGGSEPDATIEIYRKGFGSYPEYDDTPGTGVPAAPTYPPAGWTLAATLPSGTTTYSDQPPARDFWYYVAFVVDECNVSGVSNVSNGRLNYHLGDVSDGTTPGAGDNLVGLPDISLLGGNYGISLIYGDTYNYLDVGPTTDYSVNARPTTDNKVQFEDLMVFAINYGTVSKPLPRLTAADRNALLVDLSGSATEIQAVLTLASDGAVQGVSVPLRWNADVVEPVAYAAGAWADRQAGRTLVLSPEAGVIDAAVFGATFSGEGELATVTFRVRSPGDPGIGLGEVVARDVENRPVALGVEVTDRDLPVTPTVTRLLPLAPNPFLGSTQIRFALSEPGEAVVRVYGVDGRLVRTLIDAALPAGEKSVTWDGRDEMGRTVAAGSYLVRFQATGKTESMRVMKLR